MCFEMTKVCLSKDLGKIIKSRIRIMTFSMNQFECGQPSFRQVLHISAL